MRVLFVCLGNICRSPAAEAIFTKKIEDLGKSHVFSCESAGIIGAHSGEFCDPRMKQALNQRGYDSTTRSRKVQKTDFETFDFILGMDNSNIDELKALKPHTSRASIHAMCEFAIDRHEYEVPDPYYGGAEGFDTVIDILDDTIRGFIQKVHA